MEIGAVNTALRRATKNVMSPGVTLAALITIPCISGALFATAWIAIWLLSLASVVGLGTFGIFLYHSIKQPLILRSEEFHLKKDAIEIYGSTSYHGDELVRIINSEAGLKKIKSKEEGGDV
jgi:hypothetical protein